MGRHGRNATASAVYSYHEKKKDTEKSGYGSHTVRLGKDSIKDFDCCCLTLQPCRDPVLTLDGYLYDKQAILECLLHQKTKNARKMKEFEMQKKKHALGDVGHMCRGGKRELEELGKAEARSKVERFLSTEQSIISKPVDAFQSEVKEAPSISNVAELPPGAAAASAGAGQSATKKSKVTGTNPSFWIPSLTPDAKPTLVKKPDMKTYCPMSGRVLRVKDLIPVKFTVIADRDHKTATIVKQARYMCPVTHDVLGNSIPCAVLKPTGDVVTMECVDKLIRTSDMLCPISGRTLKDSDIISIVRGGTGFAASGVVLEASKAGAAMMV